MEDKKFRIVFKCHKCEHQMHITTTGEDQYIAAKLHKLLYLDCPSCGEEPYENWILIDSSILED